MSNTWPILWCIGGLLSAQVGLSSSTRSKDFRPPDLSHISQSSKAEEEFLRAKSFAEKGDFEKALPILERAHKKAPMDLETLFWLGYVRESLHDTAGAIQAYQAFLKQSPQPEVFFRLGLLQLGQGSLSEAALSLQKAVEERPAWADAQVLCAYALYVIGRGQEALPHAREAILLDKTSEFAPLLLGEIYFALDSFAQAQVAYEEALRRNSSSAAAHLGLGKSLLALSKPQEALLHLQRAAETLPQDVQVYYYLGLAYRTLERNSDAITAFQKALAIDPTHARSHYEMARIYIQEKKPAQAETHYQALQKYNPKLAGRLAPLLGK